VEANKTIATHGEQGLQNVLLQKEFEVAQAYQIVATPSALLVRADGKIGSPLAAGADEIRALVDSAVGLAPMPTFSPIATGNAINATKSNGDCGCGQNGANGNSYGNTIATTLPLPTKRGELAPTFSLPDLKGNQLALESLRGSPTLILFWNPGCGYCRQMLDDLKAWEANPPQDAPKLLIVSTGSVEANQAMNLQSPTVLDTDFTTARAFGARGTPSVIFIDAEGRIASEVAAGRDAVLALARGEEGLLLTATR
jgi:peroxiredoxin